MVTVGNPRHVLECLMNTGLQQGWLRMVAWTRWVPSLRSEETGGGMFKRRYANYLAYGEEPRSDDTKPAREGPTSFPTRPRP
jgi:hypothetical protein